MNASLDYEEDDLFEESAFDCDELECNDMSFSNPPRDRNCTPLEAFMMLLFAIFGTAAFMAIIIVCAHFTSTH